MTNQDRPVNKETVQDYEVCIVTSTSIEDSLTTVKDSAMLFVNLKDNNVLVNYLRSRVVLKRISLSV